jgi:hypothetical protein
LNPRPLDLQPGTLATEPQTLKIQVLDNIKITGNNPFYQSLARSCKARYGTSSNGEPLPLGPKEGWSTTRANKTIPPVFLLIANAAELSEFLVVALQGTST